jgi:cytochrome P450
MIEQMIDIVGTAVEAMVRRGSSGRPLDVIQEMTRITHSAVIRVFFGNRIPAAQGHRMAKAIDVAVNSVNARLLLPFVPHAIPLPGDLAFNRAVQTVDDIMVPLVRRVRRGNREGTDIVAVLCRAHTEGSDRQCERRIRDDVVSMFGAASETTAMTLTWFWTAMSAHPEAFARVRDEVIEAVGTGPLTRGHLGQLRITKAALNEVLRVYPPGWIIPRTAVADDELGGVRIARGRTVLVSPYLTHRMPSLWDRPHDFNPDRFLTEHAEPRHRYAYFPFSGGPHQCLGSHFFTIEAQIIVASMLQRVRPEVLNAAEIVPKVAATLRPRQSVVMTLRPSGGV